MTLDSKAPTGPIEQAWEQARFDFKLVNPANKRKHNIIVVGSGLAGASASATLGELGYKVQCFCFQDSPRRAHSIAAQGGINAAKNYQNDGDSVYRLFYDTVKGGDFRAREANVYRLAQISVNIIDQCVAQGVPFAREYGGALTNRSFGGAQVSRTFYARGQTGQQLLLGAYQALERQIHAGTVTMHPRTEMLDLIVIDGKARGIVARHLVTGAITTHFADAVILGTGGYGNVYYLSTNAKGSNVTAIWRAHKRGALFANPCYTQIHPTCIPVSGDYQSKLTLMSESLRNDGRIWVPMKNGDKRSPEQIPEAERDYYLERRYPSFGNLVPRDVASRNAKAVCDEGRGVGETGLGVYLDFTDAIRAVWARRPSAIATTTCSTCTSASPMRTPTRFRCASIPPSTTPWAACGWTTTCKAPSPACLCIGEANFSDHGANRLGASALMQGLSDGYFVVPYTVGNYLATNKFPAVLDTAPEVKQAVACVKQTIDLLLSIKGKRTVDSFHRELGKIVWDYCGMSRTAEGLESAIGQIRALQEEYWKNVNVPGSGEDLNQSLEKAGRVADFFELAELMCIDALNRNESCGGHFREEYQTPEGEAQRDDENYSYVAAWDYRGPGNPPTLTKEPLEFHYVHPSQRSYK